MSQTEFDVMQQVYDEADLLHSQAEVDAAMDRMASDITAALGQLNPVLFAVMNGGLVIGGQLLTRLHFPLQVSYLHATRYRNTTSGCSLEWKVPPMVEFKGRPVLILDDILDEGHTLAEIVEYCEREGAASVQTAVLVNKLHDRKARPGMKADYTGMDIEDRYVFGFGMDYKGYWRNAPGIFAVKGL
ncbi:hypoxanthine-guanine phosphoribosyltransferase [Nitrincola alkalilacustris]|uniref:hypoxanthine-guanine phosphoribosyltransferase n=1 Tax=Nitrincola alkalilacustris TaxID=1571224 RepID=UPI00124D5947|nr:hypoxanthine-guanine phosphoribosyltransferase [Nitrincola alkalilacustris]